MGGAWIDIATDDSVESVAYRHGHFPDTIWQHAENAELREERASMHVLCAGDKLFVADIVPKSLPCSTSHIHCFTRRAVPSLLRIRLMLGEQPIIRRPCRMESPGRVPVDAHSDHAGWVHVPVLPDAAKARLMVTLEDGSELQLDLSPRALNPVDTTTGVQARLRNLGYLTDATDGAIDLPTVLALARFQNTNGLGMTGTADAATRTALVAAYGT
jgi:hypothetical protein